MKKLFNNKRGVKFENILIAFIIFSLFIIGGTMMIVDLNNKYGEFGVNMSTEEFSDVYDVTEDIFDIAEGADDKAFQGDTSETESADSTIRGSYSILRFMGSTYGLFQAITNAIQETLGIPVVIVNAAFTAFTLIIVFSVVYLIFRFIPK